MKLTGLKFYFLIWYKTVRVNWWSRSSSTGNSYHLWIALSVGSPTFINGEASFSHGVAIDHFCGRGVPLLVIMGICVSLPMLVLLMRITSVHHFRSELLRILCYGRGVVVLATVMLSLLLYMTVVSATTIVSVQNTITELQCML